LALLYQLLELTVVFWFSQGQFHLRGIKSAQQLAAYFTSLAQTLRSASNIRTQTFQLGLHDFHVVFCFCVALFAVQC